MNIKPISTIQPHAASLNFKSSAKQNSTHAEADNKENKTAKKHHSKLPYAAGAIILAGLGIYVSRNKIKNILNKKNLNGLKQEILENKTEYKILEKVLSRKRKPIVQDNLKEIVKAETKTSVAKPAEINPLTQPSEVLKPNFIRKAETQKESFIKNSQKFDKHASDIQDVIPETVQAVEKQAVKKAQAAMTQTPGAVEMKTVCAGFDEQGAPIYEKVSPYIHKTSEASTDAYQSVKQSLKLNDQAIISKIVSNRESQMGDIKRIINENTHDGKIDMPMMHKIAKDFASDAAGRGENRYHQAADLLEQTYLKRYVKGGAEQKEGLQDMFDLAKSESPLFEIYTRMPKEEAVSRLRYLADNDLKSASYKGMNAEGFFGKALERLNEKFQFKKYNEAHGIKPEF